MVCKYIISKGELIVYVNPGCSRASRIHGILVTSKIQCKECRKNGNKQNI